MGEWRTTTFRWPPEITSPRPLLVGHDCSKGLYFEAQFAPPLSAVLVSIARLDTKSLTACLCCNVLFKFLRALRAKQSFCIRFPRNGKTRFSPRFPGGQRWECIWLFLKSTRSIKFDYLWLWCKSYCTCILSICNLYLRCWHKREPSFEDLMLR